MANAEQEVKKKYPNARVVRGPFGLVVVTDDEQSTRLGDARAYWDEEAWINAAEAEGL
jgi:hypothetical protein